MKEEKMTAKDWLKKAELTWKRHERADGSLKGMSVHNLKGDRLHKKPYCTAEGAVKYAKQEFKSKDLNEPRGKYALVKQTGVIHVALNSLVGIMTTKTDGKKKDKETMKPTAWKFVWSDGRYFSSLDKKTIEDFAKGARMAHGENCGHIEPMFDENPYIVEGRA